MKGQTKSPPPPHQRADRLWRRLAEAQDAAIQREAPPAPRVTERSRWRPIGVALLGLGAAAALIVLLVHRAPLRARVGVGGAVGSTTSEVAGQLSGQPDRLLVADARSDLPLQFSDGSRLTFRSGSSGRMQRIGSNGAEVFLEKGRLEARIVHAEGTLWLVHAGPYRVRVTGTRFAVTWSVARLDVALFEGSVVIDGAVLGAGVPLRAGQRLSVDSGVVRTERLGPDEAAVAFLPPAKVGAEPPSGAASLPGAATGASPGASPAGSSDAPPLQPPPAPPASVAASAGRPDPGAEETRDEVAPARSRAGDENDWLVLAKHSAYAEAFSAAKRVGWARLCHRLDAHRLLTLADVARYAGAQARAREAFEALVLRFPRDPLAADAVFSLGRQAVESDQPDRAARWFRRYVADWPHGPLADQAVGRLVECEIQMHDLEAARGAARAYLARAPGGPHARLAREILRDVPHPTASVSP